MQSTSDKHEAKYIEFYEKRELNVYRTRKKVGAKLDEIFSRGIDEKTVCPWTDKDTYTYSIEEKATCAIIIGRGTQKSIVYILCIHYIARRRERRRPAWRRQPWHLNFVRASELIHNAVVVDQRTRESQLQLLLLQVFLEFTIEVLFFFDNVLIF